MKDSQEEVKPIGYYLEVAENANSDVGLGNCKVDLFRFYANITFHLLFGTTRPGTKHVKI